MIAVPVAILLVTALGVPLSMVLHRDAPWSARVGEGFFFGCGWTTTAMFVLSVAGVKWSIVSIVVASAAPLLLLVPLMPLRSPEPPPEAGRVTLVSRALDLATILLVASYAIYATLGPMWERDFWGIFGAKGRAFFEQGGVDWAFLTSPFHAYMHPDYPLAVPLLFDLAAVLNGEWDDRWIGLYYPAFTIALLLVTRTAISREARSPEVTSATSLLIAALSMTTTPGTADAPLIALGAAALIILRDGSARNDDSMIRAAAILLGIAALTKNEGIAMVVAAAAGFAFETRSLRRTVSLWPAAACAVAWIVTARALGFRAAYLRFDSLFERMSDHAARSAEIVAQLATTPPAHLLFWLAALLLLAVSMTHARRERLLLTFVALQLLFYLGAYAVTPFPLTWQIQNSWARLLSHLAIPLAFAAMAAGLRWRAATSAR